MSIFRYLALEEVLPPPVAAPPALYPERTQYVPPEDALSGFEIARVAGFTSTVVNILILVAYPTLSRWNFSGVAKFLMYGALTTGSMSAQAKLAGASYVLYGLYQAVNQEAFPLRLSGADMAVALLTGAVIGLPFRIVPLPPLSAGITPMFLMRYGLASLVASLFATGTDPSILIKLYGFLANSLDL